MSRKHKKYRSTIEEEVLIEETPIEETVTEEVTEEIEKDALIESEYQDNEWVLASNGSQTFPVKYKRAKELNAIIIKRYEQKK